MRQHIHAVAGEQVTINVVEHEDDLEGFRDFVRRNIRFLGLDSETTGLDIYSDKFRIRLVQFGIPTESWVVPVDPLEVPERFREDVRVALRAVRGFVVHNASYDLQVIERCLGVPMEELWPKVTDTKILAHLVDPRMFKEGGAGHSLEEATLHYIDEDVANNVKTLMADLAKTHKTTKANVWKKVTLDDPHYQLYSGMDPILAARLMQKTLPLIPPESKGLIPFEHKLAEVCSYIERTGVLLDQEYAKRFSGELRYQESINNELALGFGCEKVNSTDQVADVLAGLGFQVKGRTPSGARQVNDDVLNEAIEKGGDLAKFAHAVTDAKRAGSWRKTWVQKFIDMSDPQDRCHPNINPLQARTGRMCLPYSEKLVTRRGTLDIEHVLVGDETLDENGNWVEVRAVHKYDNVPVVTYRSHRIGDAARYSLRSTADHRWVQISSKGNIAVRPITASSQTKVRLAPFRNLDPVSVGCGFITNTLGEIIASVVGLLVTDGRLAPGYKKGEGHSALIYQTERKFYQEILDLIPDEWVSYDRITNGADHHEIGLRIRELRKVFPAELFTTDTSLKHSDVILRWCNSLPINECAAFLRACYLADGSVSSGNRVISAQVSPAQQAMRIAGYRCGWLSTVKWCKESEWSNGPRSLISFRPGTLSLTSMSQEVTSHEPVWCVSTSTGTFTAEGELGVYLTGNSISGIPTQNLPADNWTVRRCFLSDPGHLIASVDYQTQELRVLAALSGDATMIEAFRRNADLHQITADAAGVERKVGKMANFLNVFGGGPGKLALDAGISFPLAKRVLDAFNETYPGVTRLSHQLQREASEAGYIVTPVGRRLPVDPTRAYSALNYKIQSTSRDVTARAMLRLHDAGFTPSILMPIHDEVLCSLPEQQARWGATEIGRIMQEQMGPVTISTDAEVGGRAWGSLYLRDEDRASCTDPYLLKGT